MTRVSVSGTEFHIDGEPTYRGRTYEEHKIQGLLFNVRAVQATILCHTTLFPPKAAVRPAGTPEV